MIPDLLSYRVFRETGPRNDASRQKTVFTHRFAFPPFWIKSSRSSDFKTVVQDIVSKPIGHNAAMHREETLVMDKIQ